jgi:hypothetical protein
MTVLRKLEITEPITLERSKGETEMQRAVNASWAFAKAVLWPKIEFSEREILHNKGLIENNFDKSADPRGNVVQFCVRVMLAKNYIDSTPGYRLQFASVWLNENYASGYAGTKDWYEKLKNRRTIIPGYAQALYTLANAVYRFGDTFSNVTFKKYHDRLMRYKAFNYLQLFNNTVINLMF